MAREQVRGRGKGTSEGAWQSCNKAEGAMANVMPTLVGTVC